MTHPWSTEAVEQELGHAAGVHYVAEDPSGRTVGFILGRSGDFAEILMVCVDLNAQGQGLGLELMRGFLGHLSDLGTVDEVLLEVSSKNTKAISMYESLGFTIYRVRAQYYRDLSDGLCMKLKLAKPQ